MRGIDVLLVTGDEKEDWWWRHRSEFLGPRIELVDELKAVCGRQLYMMRPIDLLRRSSALNPVIRKESVDDVERVSLGKPAATRVVGSPVCGFLGAFLGAAAGESPRVEPGAQGSGRQLAKLAVPVERRLEFLYGQLPAWARRPAAGLQISESRRI